MSFLTKYLNEYFTMRYQGRFVRIPNRGNTLDDTEYVIEINTDPTDTTSTPKELILARHPIVITTDSEGLFSPIKSRSARISILTKEPIYDVYASGGLSTRVTLKQGSNILFYGYLTPNVYNQPFEYINKVELEAVDAVSTLKYFQYKRNPTNKVPSVNDLLKDIKVLCGYSNIGFNDVYPSVSVEGSHFNQMRINLENFFGDTDKEEPWTYYEILEELCKYMGVSAVPYGDRLILVDYKAANHNLKLIKGLYVSPIDISLDETYNKVIVTANTYVLDDIDDNDITVRDRLTYASQINFLKDDDEYRYNIRFMNNDRCNNYWYSFAQKTTNDSFGLTRFTDYYSSLSDIPQWNKHWNILPTDNVGSEFIYGSAMNKKDLYDLSSWDAHLALSFNKKEQYTKIQTKYNGEDKVFNCYNTLLKRLWNDNPPLFEYKSKRYYPNFVRSLEGTTYIILSFSAMISNTKYERKEAEDEILIKQEDNKIGLMPIVAAQMKIGNMYWNGRQWTTSKAYFFLTVGDANTEIRSNKWISASKDYDPTLVIENSGNAIPVQYKDSLQGNIELSLYQPCIAFIREENRDVNHDFKVVQYIFDYNPNGSNDGVLLQYGDSQHNIWQTKWISGEDLQLKMYGTDTDELGNQYGFLDKFVIDDRNLDGPLHTASTKGLVYVINAVEEMPAAFNFTDKYQYVLLKDFKISIESLQGNFFDAEYEKDNGDIEYSNVIDEMYVNEFSDIELKINTQDENRPISLSSIMNDDYSYVTKINNEKQEYNLVEKYVNHYSTPKKILTLNIEEYIDPTNNIEYTWNDGESSGLIRGVVDTQEWDVEYNENTIKIIEL